MGVCGSKADAGANATGSAQATAAVTEKRAAQASNGKDSGAVVKKDSAVAVNAAAAATDASSPFNENNNPKEMKVLLLGAGESGKSTVLQQLKILRKNGFTEAEMYSYVPIIYGNIIEIGKGLVAARDKFQIPLDNGLTQQEIDDLVQFRFENNISKNLIEEVEEPEPESVDDDIIPEGVDTPLSQGGAAAQNEILPQRFHETLRKLWSSKSTQSLLKSTRSSSFYLMDSTPYFMNEKNLQRIFGGSGSGADKPAQRYKPSLQDILRSRQKTSGIFDTHFDMGSNLKFHIYDVGGQRSERKKWIHCFDNVTLAIFCVSLSEYDQFLLEDKSQNRFQESLILFENIVNSRWFARSSIVLFLNKIDLFAEKLKIKPLENYFPDYTGGQDINKATKYILWRFVKLNRANLNIYPHITQATDTSNIKLVFAAIKETILENSLKDTGVIV